MPGEMLRLGRRCAFVLALAILQSPPASAQGSSADRAAAEALFKEGKRLAADGKFELACPKFEESQKLDPGIGTQFNLANCYERSGRTASAWTSFLEVASSARVAGQKDRERVARARAGALESQLIHLTVIVAPELAQTAGLEVRRNGVVVGKAQWGVPMPVDPGTQSLEASAPGKKPWRVAVELTELGTQRELSVGPLDDAPVARPEPAPRPGPATSAHTADTSSAGSTQRTIALVVGGAGVVGMGVGAVLALGAKSTYDDSDPHCDDGGRCTAEGLELRDDAVSRGNLASVVFGVGTAALIGGGVLWFTAPAAVQLGVAPGHVRVRGTW